MFTGLGGWGLRVSGLGLENQAEWANLPISVHEAICL